MQLFDDNPHLLKVENLKAQTIDGVEVYLNNETVTVRMVDVAGVDVPGVTWPLTMQYEAGSNGVYRIIIPNSITVEPGQLVTAIIDGGDQPDRTIHLECPVSVKKRTSCA